MAAGLQRSAGTRRWLAIDGAGALVSAALLGIALPSMTAWVGMPVPTLRALAIGALAMGAYSLLSARYASDGRRQLATIACVNIAYCILTGSLLVLHAGLLTPVDYAYFVGEIIVILTLAKLEWSRARQHRPGGGCDWEVGPECTRAGPGTAPAAETHRSRHRLSR